VERKKGKQEIVSEHWSWSAGRLPLGFGDTGNIDAIMIVPVFDNSRSRCDRLVQLGQSQNREISSNIIKILFHLGWAMIESQSKEFRVFDVPEKHSGDRLTHNRKSAMI
jgi:hypothetical protein